MSNNPGRDLVRKRWDKPENVQKRTEALVEYVRKQVSMLPPLTPEQRERLMALLDKKSPTD